MPNAEEFLADPLRFFIGLVAEPGAGKTRQSISFPKNYFVSIGDSYGLRTILEDPKNAPLRKNLVWHQAVDLEDKKDAKEIFRVTEKPDDRGSIFGILAHVKQMAKEDAIETVTLDGMSFISDYKGAELAKGAGTSESDRWSYYRQLKHDLTWFVNSNVMPLVTRHKLNVIITAHVQRIDEDEKQKQTSRDADMAPRIEGSFRASLAGLPRAMIYLHQGVEMKGAEQVVKYRAFCQKVKVPHVGLVPAKNSYSLPPVLDVTDKFLYDILLQSMNHAKK
jgi:hypothetical protein